LAVSAQSRAHTVNVAPLPSPLPLSVFIICKNEADRIGRTLEAVRGLSDDIVVVDSGSTDGTQALAAQLGARVVEHPFEGYGPQKRHAETLCRHPWLLNIDADEVIPPDLGRRSARCLRAPGQRRTPIESALPRSFPARARRTASPMR
jgi:glycosyltransferase involved in cell wall biosynthesis